jgi:two-component system, NarL family, invasion response regulator UvrY
LIRVLIADDHTIFRDGLRRILADAGDMELVGEAGDTFEVVEKVGQGHPDVVLLDISMPGRPAIDAVEELVRRYPASHVLILTARPEDQHAVRYLQAGAVGYMTKETPEGELLSGIRKVARGGKYLSPVLAETIAFSIGPEAQLRPHERLSNREYQVMRLIAGGKTATEIAGELNLSVKTVSTYRTRILEKMGLSNNAEIMLYAVREGLLG